MRFLPEFANIAGQQQKRYHSSRRRPGYRSYVVIAASVLNVDFFCVIVL
jgi:hypothetical protein